jgi:hypothetical protein
MPHTRDASNGNAIAVPGGMSGAYFRNPALFHGNFLHWDSYGNYVS